MKILSLSNTSVKLFKMIKFLIVQSVLSCVDILDEVSCLYFTEKGSCFDAIAGFSLGDYCAKARIKDWFIK